MWRKIEEKAFYYLMVISTVSLGFFLLLIVATIVYRGLPYLSWEMISQTPKGGYYFGREGGILNAIIGSLYLSSGAVIIALVISLPVSLAMNIHLKRRKKLVNGLRFILDLLWGIPSIVYGAFGFTLMIYLGIKASLLAGIITVAFFILPIMIRSMDEVMKNVPLSLIESAFALGSTRTEVAFKVMVRQTFPGIITAVLLAFGRGIGDVAAVLFTTGYTDNIPTSLMQQTATLPLAVFFQLGSPIPEVQNRAYAAALILTIIILVVSISTRYFGKRFRKTLIK
ncbi:MAG: phosphate ABC transporter permease PstA [Bacteroidales bacterium]|nr:phosphate ABC transporter permease PstA [Bacteroidales bacterium]